MSRADEVAHFTSDVKAPRAFKLAQNWMLLVHLKGEVETCDMSCGMSRASTVHALPISSMAIWMPVAAFCVRNPRVSRWLDMPRYGTQALLELLPLRPRTIGTLGLRVVRLAASLHMRGGAHLARLVDVAE